MGRSSGCIYCGTKEDLVLGHGKRKISCFLLLRLVFGTSLLYEVFERLIFWGFLTNVYVLEVVVCFVQASLDPPTWQGWIDVCALGLRLEGVCVVCMPV